MAARPSHPRTNQEKADRLSALRQRTLRIRSSTDTRTNLPAFPPQGTPRGPTPPKHPPPPPLPPYGPNQRFQKLEKLQIPEPPAPPHQHQSSAAPYERSAAKPAQIASGAYVSQRSEAAGKTRYAPYESNGAMPIRPLPVKPTLWAAIESADFETFVNALAAGGDLEQRYLGWTPLMKAAEEGRLPMMQLLVAGRAQLDATTGRGRAALSFAAAPSSQHETSQPRETPVHTLRFLLEARADANIEDRNGLTPYERAVKETRNDAMAVLAQLAPDPSSA